MKSKSFSKVGLVCLLISLFLLHPMMVNPSFGQVTPEVADLTDDGKVNKRDFFVLASKFKRQAGEEGYVEGLDLKPDGRIDFGDIKLLRPHFRTKGIQVSPTFFQGRVFDGIGNPLAGVTVEVHKVPHQKKFNRKSHRDSDRDDDEDDDEDEKKFNRKSHRDSDRDNDEDDDEDEKKFNRKSHRDSDDDGDDEKTRDREKEPRLVGSGLTDQSGFYQISIQPGDTGFGTVSFIGATVPEEDDPTPGLLSGQYPTIPNKPIFINGGTANVFRDMSLPERDLTGSLDLREGDIAVDEGAGLWRLTEDVEYQNAGVKMMIPAWCAIQFPPNEEPVLSITRVDSAMLPVPMPPGLSSTLFVTYQPGGTEITCSGGQELFTEFDNDDGFPDGVGNLQEGPFLAGITNGVFTPFVSCEVSGGTIRCGPLPLPFEFAWYHTDIVPPEPCPRTTVVGTVRLNNFDMDPVERASVSVPGIGPVTTVTDGSFSIPNVPAGPNGSLCFTNPFSIRASASKDLDGSGNLTADEFGASAFTPAVPGGLTNVGDIKLQVTGTVQGRVLKLSSIDPFLAIPLPGTFVNVTLGLETDDPFQSDFTNLNGYYNFSDLPSGGYRIRARFLGELPLPGGDPENPEFELKEFFGFQLGAIDFDGDLDVVNFRFTSTGSVKLTPFGFTSTGGVSIRVESLGGGLGGGFVAPTGFASGETALEVPVTIGGVQMGPCEVILFEGSIENELARVGPEDGCFINQHGEILDLGDVGPPPPP